MFREWGFLLGEVWVLLALAALIGLIAGWIIWGRRSEVNIDNSEADGLRADLNACRKNGEDLTARNASLEEELENCRSNGRLSADRIADLETQAAAVPVAVPAPIMAVEDNGDRDFDGDGIIEGKDEGEKPSTLDAPRDGGADDLKRVKGIGPKMEQLCNKLGFWHFDQIASWTDQEVAWVDANLEGFKGRVTRDTWVAQAKLLAAGEETAFSKKVDKGGVY